MEQQPTKEKIAEWKAKFGKVSMLKVGGKEAYLRTPDRKILSAANLGATTAEGKFDPMLYNEIILKNCWLAGDDEIMTDTGLFLAASKQLVKLIEAYESELVEL